VERAHQVARVLAADAAERDRAGRTPYQEIALLKESGLVPVVNQVEHGGAGLEWPTIYKLIRAVSAGDGSIGQLLAYHYMWNFTLRMAGTPEQVRRLETEAVRNRWFFAGAVNPRDKDVVATDEGDHILFNGRKSFSTGNRIADVTFLEGVFETEGNPHVLTIVPTHQPGMIPHDDWDNMGQRLTESGGVTIQGVRVPWEDALGYVDKQFRPRIYNTFNVPTGQIMFSCIYLGIARGALDRAIEMTRARDKAWFEYQRTVDEPHTVDLFGDLASKLWAAEALADQAGQEGLRFHRNPDSVTERDRGEYEVLAAAVKSRATDVALEVTSRVFEATGARSTAARYGMDVYWRNVRTHTLHDPVAYKRREVGAYVLRGEIPEPTWYS
jgi:alkylation response protein AidB-like acyl-CoA dehydrogenase